LLYPECERLATRLLRAPRLAVDLVDMPAAAMPPPPPPPPVLAVLSAPRRGGLQVCGDTLLVRWHVPARGLGGSVTLRHHGGSVTNREASGSVEAAVGWRSWFSQLGRVSELRLIDMRLAADSFCGFADSACIARETLTRLAFSGVCTRAGDDYAAAD
jgi:hypothetical protein